MLPLTNKKIQINPQIAALISTEFEPKKPFIKSDSVTTGSLNYDMLKEASSRRRKVTLKRFCVAE
jgi:hypothetical protein